MAIAAIPAGQFDPAAARHRRRQFDPDQDRARDGRRSAIEQGDSGSARDRRERTTRLRAGGAGRALPLRAARLRGSVSPRQAGLAALPSVGSEPKKVRTVTIARWKRRERQPAGMAPPATPAPAATATPATARPAATSPAPARGGPGPAPAQRRRADLARSAGRRARCPRGAHRTAAIPPPAESAASGYVVQVSSQKTESEAQASFRSLQAKFPNELGSRQPIIRRADLGAKGVFYRTMVGPFASAHEASQFCANSRPPAASASFRRTDAALGQSAPMTARAFITGLAGTVLTPGGARVPARGAPWGLILFKRNIETPAQVSRLTASFRDAVGRDAPVLVDQEGGRVQRLGPPHWPAYPPGAAYGGSTTAIAAAGLRAARLGARLIAADLHGARHRCRLPADRRRAGRRRRSGDRRPRLWRHRREGRGDRARGRGRPAGRRRAAGAQAPARPRPRHRRQPPSSRWSTPTARRSKPPTSPRSGRSSDLPLGMTAHVVFTRHRSHRSGHDFGHNGARRDSRLDRVPRTADERRHFDGGAVGLARAAHARGARGRLRSRPPLQRQARRDAGGRSARPALAGEAAAPCRCGARRSAGSLDASSQADCAAELRWRSTAAPDGARRATS